MEHYSSNLEQARELIQDTGYMTFVLMMNSKMYGLPQDRRRIYIGMIALELFCYDLQAAVLMGDKIMALIKDMEIQQALKVTDLLLNDSDELVLTELNHWLGTQHPGSPSDNDTSWQQKHQEELSKAGLR